MSQGCFGVVHFRVGPSQEFIVQRHYPDVILSHCFRATRVEHGNGLRVFTLSLKGSSDAPVNANPRVRHFRKIVILQRLSIFLDTSFQQSTFNESFSDASLDLAHHVRFCFLIDQLLRLSVERDRSLPCSLAVFDKTKID